MHQIHKEDAFGPSLGRVGMSKSKVKGQGHQGQKTRYALTTPPQYGRNKMVSLQITSHMQQARRFYRWRGVSSPVCIVRVVGLGDYCWALPRISSCYKKASIRWQDSAPPISGGT